MYYQARYHLATNSLNINNSVQIFDMFRKMYSLQGDIQYGNPVYTAKSTEY